MNIPFVDLQRQYQNHRQELDSAIQQVLNRGVFVDGVEKMEFEKAFARACGSKHCITANSGTDALYIALKMMGVGHGDEVITTACSWVSTSEMISLTGAKPVFVDIKEDYLLNAELIEEKINSRTKAILPVHLYGQMVDMKAVKSICKKYELLLLEDGAQAHLSVREGARSGSLGDAVTYSFYPGKNLGAYGDGGAIVTDDDELARKCRMFANHGGIGKHDHEMEGVYSKLDTLQSAVLSVKLQYLQEWTSIRRDIAKLYRERLADLEEVTLPIEHQDSYHVYHVFVISTDRRDALQEYLKREGVTTLIHYPVPLPFLPCYADRGFKKEDFPMAFQQSERILSLPMFPELKEEEVRYVCEKMKDFYK